MISTDYGISIPGPSGIHDQFNNPNGLFTTLRKANAEVLAGFAFTQLDDDPAHYCGWIMDMFSGGNYLAFYDNRIDADMIKIWWRDPDPVKYPATAYARKGLINIGYAAGVPVQVNDVEVVTEINALKAQVAELQAAIAKLTLPPKAPSAPSTAQ